MGEYFVIANTDTQEFVEPKPSKLWEILASYPALVYYLQAEGNLGDGGNPEMRRAAVPTTDGRTLGETQGEELPPSIDLDRFNTKLEAWWPNFGRWAKDHVRIVGSHAAEATWEEIRRSPEWENITDEILPEVRRFEARRDTPPDADLDRDVACAPDLVI
ncbi:hypothetical protein [Salinibacter altiplanensis]|uniref:hypothetical protein n=1 Tax=Salinibacter altiplanensis TaxID=1803181 RepID=UPI000C9F532D|nr:hypothetical protein [Salinibacter altiplanensis]